jgi:hypothetical protein
MFSNIFFIRYEEFNQDLYLIAFFLHPQFKGKLIIIFEFFNKIL